MLSLINSNTRDSLKKNNKFLTEFEEQYEFTDRLDKNKQPVKPTGKNKLDKEIVSISSTSMAIFNMLFYLVQLDTIEEGVRMLKERILYEYVEQVSTLTMLILIAIFIGLFFTAFKVNRMLSKAHVF